MTDSVRMRLQTSSARTAALRRRPGSLRTPGALAFIAVGACWAAGLAIILTHRVFVTNDSLSNYVHVWYVAERFWNGHGVPFRMPVLADGDAYAFPYGFVPWMSAALLRPLLGDWAVTLWLVAGAVGVVAAQWWAFPELRGGWWTALLLANPMLVEGPLLGQLPFLWAVAMLFAAIACWRSGRTVAAALLLAASQATHPAVMLPIVGPLVLARLYWEPHRGRLLAVYAISLMLAAPAIWLTLASPAVRDASRAVLLGNFFGTLSLRAIVVAAPFIGLALRRTPVARAPAALLAALVGLNVVLVPIRHNQFAWTALARAPDESLLAYIDSPGFDPATQRSYRILRVGDGKLGMYQLLRAGAHLDSEPFPESIDRRSWDTPDGYAAFLRSRDVGYVIIYAAYDTRYGTNEHALLEQLTSRADGGACAQRIVHTADYDVYKVAPEAC